MHPFVTAQSISDYGYTYTYYHARNFWGLSRWSSLWNIWVARQYLRHMGGKTLLDDVLG
jgi:hypothetical protein